MRGRPLPCSAFQCHCPRSRRITHEAETIRGTTTTYDYHYDLVGCLTEVDENADVARTYAYDADGNCLSATSGTTTVAGTYDAQDRLVTSGRSSDTYSPAGDLESKTDF